MGGVPEVMVPGLVAWRGQTRSYGTVSFEG